MSWCQNKREQEQQESSLLDELVNLDAAGFHFELLPIGC